MGPHSGRGNGRVGTGHGPGRVHAHYSCRRCAWGYRRGCRDRYELRSPFGAPSPESSFLADGEVVLTFDDGPLRAYTVPVLDALAAHCVKATFFLVGRMAVADPELVNITVNPPT